MAYPQWLVEQAIQNAKNSGKIALGMVYGTKRLADQYEVVQAQEAKRRDDFHRRLAPRPENTPVDDRLSDVIRRIDNKRSEMQSKTDEYVSSEAVFRQLHLEDVAGLSTVSRACSSLSNNRHVFSGMFSSSPLTRDQNEILSKALDLCITKADTREILATLERNGSEEARNLVRNKMNSLPEGGE